MSEERRRATDPLIEELISEVKALRGEVADFRNLVNDFTTFKRAAMWVFGIFIAIGGLITWFINIAKHVDAHWK